MIELYSANTPNGQKITIALEELGLEYQLHKLNLGELDQKQPAYLKINPNGRIPALLDNDNGGFAVFESGAMLIYLAEKTGKLMPSDVNGRSLVMQWLMFQMSALGPMMGQAGWFLRREEKVPVAIERYQNETLRLFAVLESRLSEAEYLGGEHYSIADISTWTWAKRPEYALLSNDEFPNLQRWIEQVAQRPAVQRGLEKLL
ncbi:MAG: glutathione S-transferase N-terminal domain-containing protein [Pseudomonadales bacterium]